MFEILSESSQTSALEILHRIHESLKINQFRKLSEYAWEILTDSIVMVGIVLNRGAWWVVGDCCYCCCCCFIDDIAVILVVVRIYACLKRLLASP